jgi:hypothetical protein
MTDSKERLVQWLRDAHAMEEQAETMLSGQIERLENYPEIRDRMNMHLEETRQQAKRLEQCLDRIGDGSSTLKDAGGKLIAIGQNISGMFAGDEVMKGSLKKRRWQIGWKTNSARSPANSSDATSGMLTPRNGDRPKVLPSRCRNPSAARG